MKEVLRAQVLGLVARENLVHLVQAHLGQGVGRDPELLEHILILRVV